MSSGNQSLYHQLLQRGSSKGSGSTGSTGSSGSTSGRSQFQFRGKRSGERNDSVRSESVEAEGRPRPVRVVKNDRVVRLDDSDRDLAYQPPVVKEGQAVSWKPPTFWEIMADLGLRVIEVGIASIAQEIYYFFTRRRFTSSVTRRG